MNRRVELKNKYLIDLNELEDGQILKYNADDQQFENITQQYQPSTWSFEVNQDEPEVLIISGQNSSLN